MQNQKAEKFSLTITNDRQAINRVHDFVKECLDHFQVADEKIVEVQLAVDEACTNIILYSYPAGTVGSITISCFLQGDSIVITLTDQGKPFDPTTLKSGAVDGPLEETNVGGLGVYFMKELMDDLQYEYKDGEQTLTMYKNRG